MYNNIGVKIVCEECNRVLEVTLLTARKMFFPTGVYLANSIVLNCLFLFKTPRSY